MKSLEDSVVEAMDGTDRELFQFLPYILQDLWELGASPEIINNIARKHCRNYTHLNILDLGCGKGAVSIKLAKEFGCKCFGIDAIKEFVDKADNKAKEFGVDRLCQFVVGDIRDRITISSEFNAIILGSIGPVLGNYYTTLKSISKYLAQDGIIIIDDGYIEDNSTFSHPKMLKRGGVLKQITDANMKLIDEVIIGKDEIKNSDDFIFKNVEKRCNELILKYPKKSWLFEDYIKKQIEENEVLESKVICSTMVIRKQIT